VKEKAEVLMQVQQLSEVKDELTQQVILYKKHQKVKFL
jgi:hypothetical protein